MIYKGKKLGIDRYPEKWKYLINKYSKDDAKYEYYKFMRGSSLEKYILKYGEDEGHIKYNEKKRRRMETSTTLVHFIQKYGEVDGGIKWDEYINKTKHTLENFIKRYGEVDGEIKWDEYAKKRNKNLGKEHKKADSYNTKIEYYIKRGYTISESKILLKERQATSSLKRFIKKYGEDDGPKFYQALNKRKAINLENYIKKYGRIEGELQYLKLIKFKKYSQSLKGYTDKYGGTEGKIKWDEINKSKANTLENYIKRYGEDEGIIKWNSYIKNFMKFRNNRYSKSEINFIEDLLKRLVSLDINSENIFYKDRQYFFNIYNEDFKVICPDLYFKDINLIIEFYGDYWHRNPESYIDEESLNIQERDDYRIRTLKSKFDVDVFIIWESDYKKNKKKQLDFFENKIKERYDRNNRFIKC